MNSAFSGGKTSTTDFTLYTSPYLVAQSGGRYTKHIYVGSQRIVSKLGDFDSYGADPRRIEKAGDSFNGVKVDYASKYKSALNVVKANYESLKVPYYGLDNDDYVNGLGFCCKPTTPTNATNATTATTAATSPTGKTAASKADNAELQQYYYHPDHLGSSSYISNLDGEVVQHVEYVPFGEVFLEEKNSNWNTPYLFNGKELDKETGLSYYGARYYDSKISVWLSVDPLAEKYPSMSPYAYCINNPINVIDPDGRDIIILIYGSYNTDSGAGHVSFAIGSNDNNLKYYSHYRQKDGGGITVSGVRLNDILGNFEKNNLKHGQKMPPVLAIRIKTTPEQDKLLIEKADTEIKDTWLLLNSNCTGTAKDVVEEISGIDAGFAFLINTPNEFAEDLLENNEDKIKSGVMSVIKGNEKDYLENERSAIPAIIFGKKRS